MAGLLHAHGYDPGPTQRPLLAGALAALLGTIPATFILSLFGSLSAERHILHLSTGATLVAGGTAMALAGAAYGRLFGRAANDPRGGWLFGMAFGFALWALGGVFVLPLAGGGLAPAGSAALGLFLALVIWGGWVGLLFPWIHRPLHESIERGAKRHRAGPTAAAENGSPRGDREEINRSQSRLL